MTVKKKYKKLTNAEKKMNKEFMEKWRKEGLIPPIKPKLNRNKFAKEVVQEFDGKFGAYGDMQYLFRAIGFMIPTASILERGLKVKISPEEIGVLKLLKIAMELKKFEDDLKTKGETKYNVMDMYEVAVKPVINL